MVKLVIKGESRMVCHFQANKINETGDIYARRYAILAAVMLGSIMGPLDASIVNIILPTITQFFGTDIATAQWVTMVYLLTISSLLLLYGRLGDILGYKKIYLCGIAGFTVASALCTLSPTIYWLILFRAIQGLAAGMMMSMPFALITASFPPAERGKALGINAISVSAGLAIGPTLGGLIASLSSWRYCFLINMPIGIIGFLYANYIIPQLKGQPGKIDMSGAIIGFISLFFFLLSVNSFQNLGSYRISFIMLSIAVLAGISFLVMESKNTDPLVDLDLFRNATFSFANASALLNFMSQYVMVFLTPFYLQRLLLYAPNEVGMVMSAFPLAVMAVAPLSGFLSDRIGTRTLACLGAAICALSLFLMSLLPASVASSDVVWRLALFGLGTGIFQSPNNSAVMGCAPRSQLGIASGILATVRNIGMALGIAIGGAVLYAYVPFEVLQDAVIGGPDATAFLSGLKYAYISGGILTGLAAVTSLIRGDEEGENPVQKNTRAAR